MKQNALKKHNRNETDPRYARMIFGKYRGYFMKDVPVAYLKWGVLNLTDQATATFFKDELLRRCPELRTRTKK